MKFSADALMILALLETDALGKRIGVVDWDVAVESVMALHAICHRPDTSAKDIACHVRRLKDSMPEHVFFELIGRDEELQVIKTTLPSGEKLVRRFSEDWRDLCLSPSSLNEAEYPPRSWPVWCNGKETVYVTGDGAVDTQSHES